MTKILMVDDDKDFCALTQKLLIKFGFDTVCAHDGNAALHAARQSKPNLILMDMMLPDITGPEIVRSFQEDTQLRSIPVVFLTGLVTGSEKAYGNEGVKVGNMHYPGFCNRT